MTRLYKRINGKIEQIGFGIWDSNTKISEIEDFISWIEIDKVNVDKNNIYNI